MLSPRITSILTVLLFLFLSTTSSAPGDDLGRLFKWSALIFTKFENVTLNETSYCNGAYIGTRHVITSGKCVSGINKFKVRLGPHYAQYGVDIYVLEFIYEKIINNNGLQKSLSMDRKLALIKLDENPSSPSFSYIEPIILPPQPTPYQLNDTIDTAVEANWILNEDGTIEQQWVDVTLLLCPAANIQKELCSAGQNVGEKNRNLCPKIGNPLVTGARTLIGIGSLETCADNGPQTFIRIDGYLEWIEYFLNSRL